MADNIIAAIKDPFAIVRPSRSKDIVANPPAIDLAFENPERSDGKDRLGYWLGNDKGFAEIGSGSRRACPTDDWRTNPFGAGEKSIFAHAGTVNGGERESIDFPAIYLNNRAIVIPTLKLSHFVKDRRSRLFIWREPHQPVTKQHRHDFVEISIILSGTGLHHIGRYRHRIERGTILVIDPQHSHAYEQTLNLNLINIMIHRNLIAHMARDLQHLPGYVALFQGNARKGPIPPSNCHLQLSSEDIIQVDEWICRLEEETEQGRNEGYLLAEAYLTLVVGLLCRRFGQHIKFAPRADNEIKRMMTWIEQNLAEPLSVADLAKRSNMSVRTFYRAFQKTMQMTPADFVLKTRVRRAAERLRAGEERISAIAMIYGFESPSYFTRCFRKIYGTSPAAYRNQGRTKVDPK